MKARQLHSSARAHHSPDSFGVIIGSARLEKFFEALKAFQAESNSSRMVIVLEGLEVIQEINMAIVYAGLGDADATFGWLQKAYEARDGRIHQSVRALFDRFRVDLRFLELKGRIGLR